MSLYLFNLNIPELPSTTNCGHTISVFSAYLGPVVVDVLDVDGDLHLGLPPEGCAPVTGAHAQLIITPVRLKINHFARAYHPGEVVNLEGQFIGVDVGEAVGDPSILARVRVDGLEPGDPAAGVLVLVEVDLVLSLPLELGAVVVDVVDEHTHARRGLLAHTRVGHVKSGDGEGVAALGLGVERPVNEEDPGDRVHAEHVGLVARRDLEAHLRVPPGVQVSNLK